jgi:DNA polymerase I-like protein with 3'-5' exonuclease and polymerase domains
MYREMETSGIPLDPELLQNLIVQKSRQLNEIKQKISQQVGFIPSPSDPKDWQKVAQASGVSLPLGSRGPKTDEWTVKRFRDQVPLLLDMQKGRSINLSLSSLRKIQLLAQNRLQAEGKHSVNPTYEHHDDLGRVHSGGEANPMNWTDDLRGTVKIPGYYIVEADYKALELRVLMRLSNDPDLERDLNGDVHTEVAKAIFETNNPTHEQRQIAKVVTYATMYGGGPGNVYGPVNESRRAEAEQNSKKFYKKMTPDEALKLQEAWKKKYPVASAYLEQLSNATTHAISYHGRRKELPPPDMSAEDPYAARKRLAINSPIQNTGGDLAKLGFANIYEDPRIYTLGVRLITTRHDSIVMAVPDKVPQDVISRVIKEDLESADPHFGLQIDIKFASAWGSDK